MKKDVVTGGEAKHRRGKRERRTARLVVRCHPQELTDWRQKATEHSVNLSPFVRHALNARPIARRVRADPKLLRQVAGIGNNLNQMARWCNTHKGGASAIRVLAALARIESALEEITNAD